MGLVEPMLTECWLLIRLFLFLPSTPILAHFSVSGSILALPFRSFLSRIHSLLRFSISSQDEDMKRKFNNLLSEEDKLMALPQVPAQVFWMMVIKCRLSLRSP